jgi:hypothetical protein
LAIRLVAKALVCRGKYRDRYHAYAKQMVLREPHPVGIPPTLPETEGFARMLEDAARSPSHGSRSIPECFGVVKVTRESDTPAIFANQLNKYLNEITGRWLDDQAALLTEIAFEEIGDVESERVKWLRRKVKRNTAVGKPTPKTSTNS